MSCRPPEWVVGLLEPDGVAGGITGLLGPTEQAVGFLGPTGWVAISCLWFTSEKFRLTCCSGCLLTGCIGGLLTDCSGGLLTGCRAGWDPSSFSSIV